MRFKQTKNIENLKTDLTTTLQPSIGPFRHIYTPAGGTEVTSLDQIEKDKEYVAGQGNQNFRKLSQVIHKGQKGKKKSSVSSVASSSNQVRIHDMSGSFKIFLLHVRSLLNKLACLAVMNTIKQASLFNRDL